MMAGLVIYTFLALAGVALFAIAGVKRKDGEAGGVAAKIGLGVCVAAAVVFGI